MSFKNQISDQLIASNLSAFFVVVIIQSYEMGSVGDKTHAYRGIGLDATEETTDTCCHCWPCYRRIEFNFYTLPTSPLFQSFVSFLHTCAVVLSELPFLKISEVPLLWKEMCCAWAGSAANRWKSSSINSLPPLWFWMLMRY